MEIKRYNDVKRFYNDVAPFLARREAEHCMMLGILNMLAERVQLPPPESMYFATVVEKGEIVAAAMLVLPRDLILSYSEHRTALNLLAQNLLPLFGRLPGLIGTKAVALAFAEIWSSVSKQGFRNRMNQRIYQAEQIKHPENVSGTWRKASDDDFDLLADWMDAFNKEALGFHDRDSAARVVRSRLNSVHDMLYVWLDPHPVTMVGTSGPTPNGIRINAVYTPPEYRRRGYASALTAAVTQKMFDEGCRYCFLYTDLDNPTSNRIYQAVGYEPVCDSVVIEFLDSE